MYNVFYVNKLKGIHDYIYNVSTVEEAINKIIKFLKLYNNKINYIRAYKNNNDVVIIDIGQHNIYYKLVKVKNSEYNII